MKNNNIMYINNVYYVWHFLETIKIKIERHKKIKPGKCIFPFTYKWKQHEACFPTKKGSICATEITLPRRTLRRYGYCKKKIKKELKRHLKH